MRQLKEKVSNFTFFSSFGQYYKLLIIINKYREQFHTSNHGAICDKTKFISLEMKTFISKEKNWVHLLIIVRNKTTAIYFYIHHGADVTNFYKYWSLVA